MTDPEQNGPPLAPAGRPAGAIRGGSPPSDPEPTHHRSRQPVPDNAGGGDDGLSRRPERLVPAHHRRTIERAVAATENLERAAAFADDIGTPTLERAVRAADHVDATAMARRGRQALRAFERFKRAASDERPADETVRN